MKSHQVRVWAIRVNTVAGTGKKAKKSYTVRWTVASKEKARKLRQPCPRRQLPL
jgi:hypothetical protein